MNRVTVASEVVFVFRLLLLLVSIGLFALVPPFVGERPLSAPSPKGDFEASNETLARCGVPGTFYLYRSRFKLSVEDGNRYMRTGVPRAIFADSIVVIRDAETGCLYGYSRFEFFRIQPVDSL